MTTAWLIFVVAPGLLRDHDELWAVGEAIMDKLERGFAVTAMTGFIVLVACLVWIAVI